MMISSPFSRSAENTMKSAGEVPEVTSTLEGSTWTP